MNIWVTTQFWAEDIDGGKPWREAGAASTRPFLGARTKRRLDLGEGRKQRGAHDEDVWHPPHILKGV